MLAFVGSTAYGLVGLFGSAMQQPPQNTKTAPTPQAQDSQLQAQERGYESVLKREPDNQTALQGLVQVRLQMNNLKGAIDPMEKLVRLNPDRDDYKALLAGIKDKSGQGGKPGDR